MIRSMLAVMMTILSVVQTGYTQEREVARPSAAPEENSDLTAGSKGYSIQKIRAEPLPKRARVKPSPSGDIVAVVTREQTLFYYLIDNTCSGPDTIGIGESTSSEAKRRALKESFDIFPQWQKDVAGEDVFILDIGEKTGLRRSNGKWLQTSTTRPLNKWPRAKRKHPHREIGPNNSACLLEPVLAAEVLSRDKSPGKAMRYKINTSVKRIEYADDKDAITINGIWEIHPEYDRAIVSTDDYRASSNMVYVNFETGVAKELTSKRGLRGTRGYSDAVFSPDGRWILVTLNYGPDEHVGGIFLQLFDLDGELVEELLAFSGDYSSRGTAHWLPNNWIVYHDQEAIQFLKYTSE